MDPHVPDFLPPNERRYISITSDYGFKATFGNESNDLFLRKSLQALIKSEVPIQKVHFEKNAFEALTVDGRSGIFDLVCIDDTGTHFIVEMQLGQAPHFIQRMKFYALHTFNTLVERGRFDYASLPKIYCIAFLEKSILPTDSYYTLANLRNEQGELVDAQLTFITIELAKFAKPAESVESDLDKLIYTMKTLDKPTEPTEYPAFWNEEWLSRAIEELDTRKMTPEERFQFARITAINAEAVNAERKRLEEQQANTVRNLLSLNVLTVEQIANSVDVPIDFVLTVQRESPHDA